MPPFLERKLKKEYGAKSDIPYKIMNKMGTMKGNKETAKGKAMGMKHKMDKKMEKKHKTMSRLAEKTMFANRSK